MRITRRDAVVGSAALIGGGRPAGAAGTRFTPEQFGARGDGATNDSQAFRRLAAAVTADNGGTIVLRRTTYLVGGQRRGGDAGYFLDPPPLLELKGLTGPLVIEGNGATLRCEAGLRYGTFDPATGRPTARPQPHYGKGEIAAPYRWMIKVERCAARVEIADLTLDGNLAGLLIGGGWGDTGHQLPASGIGLYDNSGPEILRDIRCINHALDGIIVDGAPATRASRSVFSNVRCRGNGRQGCSIVGGNNYRFVDCAFEDTGTGRLISAPGAGVDLEAEGGKPVRNIRFENCRFAHNAGVGLLAVEGDVAGVTAVRCTFVATRSWGAWPAKPDMRFSDCLFVGAICNAHGNPDPLKATQFAGCRFVDDPAAAGGRRVYGGDNASRPIAVLPYSENARFSKCVFRLTHDCVLPWSVKVRYADCTMSQRAPATSYPRGSYIGVNRIDGRVDVNYSRLVGTLILNGRALKPSDIL